MIRQAIQWRADKIKITTTANSKSDCSLVMGLYAKHKNILAFCMGTLGKITRVAAPLLGAEFTYASWNELRSTAPGQLTVAELKEIYKIILHP
jgi:3-dehydroquinate dehydratase type I